MYSRNANGLVSNVAAPVNGTATNLASSITYLPFGPLKGLTYGNSLTLSASFDTDYNPTNRTISGGIANWTYTTDKNSNITQAGPTTYGYDALDRVNGENGAATAYTYDATSNRLTKVQGTTTTTTVPATNNKISAVGGTAYTYDSAGNITAIGANTYGWNAAGNLGTYNTTGGVYTYNAYNQRTKKVVASVTTQYVYGPNGLLIGEYSSTGVMQREYIYLNDQPLAQVTAGSPETVAYLHTDHLGTPRFATNSAGTSVWSWANDAFGVSTPSGTVTVNLRMPGQYYDSESGLFYNWNRYYNPAIGRYVSSDRIGVGGGLNTYSYGSQNPIIFIDPLGFGFRYGLGLLDWLPNIARAAEVGTWQHQQFFAYINKQFPTYQTNTVLQGAVEILRPDVVGDGKVWELKPSSCQVGWGRRAAEMQLKDYTDSANLKIGDPHDLVGDGLDFEVSIFGQPFKLHFYPDADPASGLIYYELQDTQHILQPLWNALKSGTTVTTPGAPPAPILIFP